MNSRLVVLIFGGSLVGAAAICGLVFWMLSNGDKAARHASDQFGAALVRGSAPPKGAADYVGGVREHFGSVSAARVIDARNVSVGHGQSSRTFYVADVLVQTARGPAVLELEFDSPSLTYSNERVTGVAEVMPRDVPDNALSDRDFAALAKAFVARGGKAADDMALSGAFSTGVFATATPEVAIATPRPVRTPRLNTQQQQAMKQLRCVQRAKGDIEKLQRCATAG